MCKKKQFRYCPSEIDECLKMIIYYLRRQGIEPVSSCCGHGKYPPSIVVCHGFRKLEIFSGKIIPRKKRFYRKDKEGYYYIPEIISFLPS